MKFNIPGIGDVKINIQGIGFLEDKHFKFKRSKGYGNISVNISKKEKEGTGEDGDINPNAQRIKRGPGTPFQIAPNEFSTWEKSNPDHTSGDTDKLSDS